MFLKCSEVKSTNGKVNKYYKIVESIRENGKIKHKILFNLGSLSDSKALLIRQIISGVSNPDLVTIDINDIVIDKNLDFLDAYVLHLLWQEWGFNEFFKKYPFVEILTINRCIKHSSKIGAIMWSNENIFEYLIPEIKTKNKYGVYLELDKLCDLQESLQQYICDKIKISKFDKPGTIIYDITSTYFEDTNCVIAVHGYSRDCRPDKEQIVIALAITPKGYPFYWKTYKGNTADVTTIDTFIDELKLHCGIKSGLLVFDRGMVSADNITYITSKKFKFITAVDKDEIKSTGIENLDIYYNVSEENMSEVLVGYVKYDDSLYYREHNIDAKRYVLGFSIVKRNDELACRQRKIQRIKCKIEEINLELSNAKKSRDLEKLKIKVASILKSKKVTKFIEVSYEQLILKGKKKDIISYKITFSVNEDELKKSGQFDGVTCFYSNAPAKSITAYDIIYHYRKKNKVEESFHEIKSFVKIRPIFVHKEERVKAHVCICILAYLLFNTIEQRILNIENLSATTAIQELAKCKINFISLDNGKFTNLTITKLSNLQKNILSALKLDNLLSSKEIELLLLNMKNCSPTL